MDARTGQASSVNAAAPMGGRRRAMRRGRTEARIDQVFADQRLGEDMVLLAARDELGHHAVVRVQAVTPAGSRAGGFDDHNACPPAARKYGRGDADILGIVAIGSMEFRQLADRSVDLVRFPIVWSSKKVTSTSIDAVASTGNSPSGIAPRIDWLPITTISESPVMWAADRSTCSS